MFVADVKCSQATWQLFQIRGPAAPKLLSPKLLCVHMLSEEDRRDRRLPSETRVTRLSSEMTCLLVPKSCTVCVEPFLIFVSSDMGLTLDSQCGGNEPMSSSFVPTPHRLLTVNPLASMPYFFKSLYLLATHTDGRQPHFGGGKDIFWGEGRQIINFGAAAYVTMHRPIVK